MQKHKYERRHHHKYKFTFILPQFLLGMLTGIIFIGIGAFTYLAMTHATKPQQQHPHPILENKKNVAKELPEEFKKQVTVATPSGTLRVPILMYHYVENVQDKKDKERMSLNIPPAIFDEQIKTLKDAGYTFMTAKDLGDVLDGKIKLPDKPVLITFDDGHWDFATDVLPILEKYQVKATEYVIPGFIGGSDFMTSHEVQEVVDSGLVDVGAHTVHHISLRGQSLAKDQYEIDESKTMLEKAYHIHVVSFAYPYGTFDQQAVQVTKDDGFTTAVSTVPGIMQNQTNRFYLYRIRPGYRTDQVLLDYLSQDTFKAF